MDISAQRLRGWNALDAFDIISFGADRSAAAGASSRAQSGSARCTKPGSTGPGKSGATGSAKSRATGRPKSRTAHRTEPGAAYRSESITTANVRTDNAVTYDVAHTHDHADAALTRMRRSPSRHPVLST